MQHLYRYYVWGAKRLNGISLLIYVYVICSFNAFNTILRVTELTLHHILSLKTKYGDQKYGDLRKQLVQMV